MLNHDSIPIERCLKPANSGYVPRDFRKYPAGTFDYETPFDDAMELMPVEEIIETLILQEKDQSSLWHVWAHPEMGNKFETNQGQLGYCHAFSPKGAMLLLRARDGLEYVELSGSSVGAPVTGYRNRGAQIFHDLKQATEVGFATTKFVPDRTTNARDFKEGWKESAARHRFSEWLVADGSRNRTKGLHQQLTAACRNSPGCNGLNYWGHAVTDLRFVLTSEPVGVKTIQQLMRHLANDFLNSWTKRYGKEGIGRRVGERMVCDQLYIPTVPTPSSAE